MSGSAPGNNGVTGSASMQDALDNGWESHPERTNKSTGSEYWSQNGNIRFKRRQLGNKEPDAETPQVRICEGLGRIISLVYSTYKVLDMPLLDTRRNKDLTGTLIADIVLQLLSYVAETERSFIRQRQKEGIKIALENGTRFGQRPMERPEGFEALKEQYQSRLVTAREAAKQLGITHSTFLFIIGRE